ncbi:tyrosine-type recombinase/integrase [Candidatus Woesearchaeota archaeon]|nr:tyrosine-type recombinase/integrase [Candidatus Woesearchaeota archaeon]
MPIIDYGQHAVQAEQRFFASKEISQKNKAAMTRYIAQYDVRPATRLKFFNHIRFLLEMLSDVERQMHDRELVNKTFAHFRKSLKPGYYATLVNVSKAFVRWLNDGDLPKGFKDVKGVGKKDQRRDLAPEDMWTWDDAKQFCKFVPSIQIQAALATQLDAGLRPSEFVDLNYGDVTIKRDVVIFQVREGKTGSRPVPCARCPPFFLKWYHAHPTRKANDPLWVMEFNGKSHPGEPSRKEFTIRRYEYTALLKRFRTIALKAGIRKSVDFYTLRHSSCTLDKLENVPLEVAATRHGHTVKYFTEVYARLDLDGIANRLRQHYAGSEQKLDVPKNRVCERCEMVNEPASQSCFKCGLPFSVAEILGLEKQRDDDVAELRKRTELLAGLQKEMVEMRDLLGALTKGKFEDSGKLDEQRFVVAKVKGK